VFLAGFTVTVISNGGDAFGVNDAGRVRGAERFGEVGFEKDAGFLRTGEATTW